MLDARREALFIKSSSGVWEDKTAEIDTVRFDPSVKRCTVRYIRSGKEFSYGIARSRHVLSHSEHSTERARVFIDDERWRKVEAVADFNTPDGPQRRVFWRNRDGGKSRMIPAARVRIEEPINDDMSKAVLAYFEASALALPDSDPTRGLYDRDFFASPASALGTYLAANAGTLPEPLPPRPHPRITPFDFNLSQRDAVKNALSSPISIIEGPPGTGKTQTILNIVANLIVNKATVAVVSSNNSAADNVREKLEDEGLGFVVAALGRSALRKTFFENLPTQQAARDRFLASPVRPRPDPARISELDARLVTLQETERTLAQLELEATALELEQRHHARFLENEELPDLAHLRILKRSSDKILRYLADTSQDGDSDGPLRTLVRSFRRYLEFGSTRDVDPQDTATVLELQRRYYENRLTEIAEERAILQKRLDDASYTQLNAELQTISRDSLHASLRERYAGRRVDYDVDSYKANIEEFLHDFPVMVSTCHSLKKSIGEHFVDYLIIDEASQLNLLVAAPALACARNVIIVGDQRQLPHIVKNDNTEDRPEAPSPDCDYVAHSLLSSVATIAAGGVPRTLLREHYRCDSQIIGFCNTKFYADQLVPFTTTSREGRPLMVVTTAPGNHMRSPRGGSRTNEREVEVVEQEVIPQHFAHLPADAIGVTSAYARQVEKFQDALDGVHSSTVHKFQGREKDVVIMSAVLDQSRDGNFGIKFADDPKLINVAVSRAKKQFVLVTEHGKLPRSRHLRDLIGYIEYSNPDEPTIESNVLSVFDLLYKRYSEHLQSLASRLKNDSKFASENILATVLADLIEEDAYSDLGVHNQKLLKEFVHDESLLDDAKLKYIKHRASVDFVVFNRVTKRVVLVIEVDGYAHHENDPVQLERDRKKDAILQSQGVRLLRLPTTGSGEVEKIRRELDAALAGPEGVEWAT